MRAGLGKTLGDKVLNSSSSHAGAAFHHGEPSCQLPLGKMLGVRVRLATALAALWFCITGEGSSVGTGGGAPIPTRAPAKPVCLAGMGRVLANLLPLSPVTCPPISTGIP